MRKFIVLVFIVLVSSLEAQTSEEKTNSTFGIGISLEQSYSFIFEENVKNLPISLGNIYFPINISKNFRIEPDVGIYIYDYAYEDYEDYFNYYKKIINQFRVGLGFHYVKSYGSINILFGVRFGSIFNFRTREYADFYDKENEEDSATILFGGPSIGAEYYFAKRFSLGAEAQLNYISLGEYGDDEKETRTIISTRALILLRFYF